MIFKDKLSQVEKSKEFVDWKKDNKESFLAHVFRMFDDVNEKVWQFGFYNADDTITTFFLEDESVKEIPQEKIFKKDDHKLVPLDLSKVKLSFDEALKKAQNIQKEKYKSHPVMKSFVILQVVDDMQVFNFTFVTQTFNTLNIRLDSETGDVKKEALTSLMDMAKFEKGKKQDYIG